MGLENPMSRLGDFTDLTVGFAFKSAEFGAEAEGPRLLRGDNVAQGGLRWEGAKYWPSGMTQDLERYELRVGDVVVAMDRPWIEAGLKYARVRDSDLPALLVQRVARLRGKELLDSGYLNYVIGSRRFTEYVKSVQTGSTVPHISSTQIRDFEFPLPPLNEQRRIAHILGTLDDKIELNRQMSETLEEMARALFKSWFVDFDPVRAKAEGRDPGLPPHIVGLFPDRLVDSELGAIPAGWEVGRIEDLASVHGGSTPSTKEPSYWDGGEHAWASPKDLAGVQHPVLRSTSRAVTDSGLAKISSGLNPPGTVLMSSRAPIGYIAIAEIPVAVNQGFIAMRPKIGVPSKFIQLWTEHAMPVIKGNANGSTFQEISKKNFRVIPVVIPPAELLASFGDCVSGWQERLVGAVGETRLLEETRDVLLGELIG